MQFFKATGYTVYENKTEGQENRYYAKRERAKSIRMKSTEFNSGLDNDVFIFISEITDDMCVIAVILKDQRDVKRLTESFLKAVDIHVSGISITEITLGSLAHLLRDADNGDYIDDDDAVLERFELDRLNGRRAVDYDENMLDESTWESIYAEAEQYLSEDSLIPELDRIFQKKGNGRTVGHPVHYFVETDDREIRKGMYRLILSALYANNRLNSRRYCYLDLSPGDDFSMASYECLYKMSEGGAVVIRYLANDDLENDQASSGRETISEICEMMKKYRNRVLTLVCMPRECRESKSIFYENLGNIGIVELKEEFVTGERAERFLRMLAKHHGIRPDSKLFIKLEKDGGYLAPDLHEMFDEWYDRKLRTKIYPQYGDVVTAKAEVIKSGPKGSAYDELMEMIGIGEVKRIMKQALDFCKAQKVFADMGMNDERPSMHMVFTGNPGTAKTTAARLFSRIMKENDILSKGRLIEVGRADLVGKYVGWTAPLIKKKFNEAKGSVLFIDEAYSLVDDRDGSYGDEAINTIVQEMENHRQDVVVIFAGYPDKMERFLEKNPGLRSRIAFHVPFNDYSTEELIAITELIAKKKGLKLAGDVREKLLRIYDEVRTENDFGNGRYARNLIEKARMAQASRLLSVDYEKIGKDDIATICADDIEIPKKTGKNKRRPIGFTVA